MGRIETLLRRTVEMLASDLHIKADSKPYVRIHGELIQLEDEQPFTPETARDEIFQVVNEQQKRRFERDLELDFAYEIEGLSRFRGNIYQQKGLVQAAFRVIPFEILTLSDL